MYAGTVLSSYHTHFADAKTKWLNNLLKVIKLV